MPQFWTFWEQAAGLPMEEQTALFRQLVVGPHPDLFTANVIGRDPSQPQAELGDERLRNYLNAVPEHIQSMRSVSESLAADLQRYDRTFRQAFPDMGWNGTVYFTVSLDTFDGAARTVGNERALLFGVDKIARLHGADANLGPLFHHELFHMYHASVNPPPDFSGEGPFGILYPLWAEGLAVYVAKTLNPDATARQLVLSEQLIAESEAVLPALAAELRTQLDETTEVAYRDFFLGAGQRSDIPVRCGYYVGLRVAETLGRERTLAQLARLSGDDLRAAVDDALAAL